MHILYFHQHFSTISGSTGTRSYEMSKALIRAGHRVTMVCGSFLQGESGLNGPYRFGMRRGIISGIEVIELNLKYSNKLSFWPRILVFAKYALITSYLALTEKKDLIFATSTPLTAAIPGIVAKKILGLEFVFEVRDLWPELPKAMGVITNRFILRMLEMIENSAYRSADRIIGLSPGIVAGIEKRGIPNNKITLIPNGCDIDHFGNPHVPWCPPEVPKKNFVAVYAGTHGKANGLDSVLDAAILLKAMNRFDISIVLIGDGSEKLRLQKRKLVEGLTNVFFLDPIPKYQLTNLFARADVGLQILKDIPAFYYGTSPNKFFDYLAAGLPIITNYPGWISDLIQEHQCGISVSPENAKEFAGALVSLEENRAINSKYGKKAKQLGLIKFDRKALAKEFVNWVTLSATE